MTKKVGLITMGGTISAKGKDRTDLKDYVSGLLAGQDFLDTLPELSEIATIDLFQHDSISSTQINENHWIQLKEEIEHLLNNKNYDGIVITHGTNTLEETAYFLHLTVNSKKPIVLVGAQRPFTALSSDAQLNLINAVRVAVHPDSINKGVLVAVNDEIHSAREVTKTNTYRLETFQSGDAGILGLIDPDGAINYYRSPIRNHTHQSLFTDLHNKEFPQVEIVYSYAGATGKLIDWITESRSYAGIVIAGTGAGRFSKKEEEALHKARENGLMIVRSSRVGHGRVIDIEPFKELNGIAGDNLSPQKARVLLMLSLAKYNEVRAIQKVFDTY